MAVGLWSSSQDAVEHKDQRDVHRAGAGEDPGGQGHQEVPPPAAEEGLRVGSG